MLGFFTAKDKNVLIISSTFFILNHSSAENHFRNQFRGKDQCASFLRFVSPEVEELLTEDIPPHVEIQKVEVGGEIRVQAPH